MLDNTHEVLTTTGWKKIDQITTLDIIATHNLDSNSLEWYFPNKITIMFIKEPHIFDKQTQLQTYIVDSQYISLCTTIDHKMLTKAEDSAEFTLKSANEISNTIQTYKTTYTNDNTTTSVFELPHHSGNILINISISMNSWLTFFGIYIIYGDLSEVRPFITFDLNKIYVVNKKIHAINKLLTVQMILGTTLEYSEENKLYHMHSSIIYRYLKQFKDINNRTVPDFILKLGTEQSALLLEVLTNSSYAQMNCGISVYIESKAIVDTIQILALNVGLITRIIYDEFAVELKYVIFINSLYCAKVKISEQKVEHQSIKPENTKMYGILVKNDIFMTRKDGRCCWTSN